MQLQERHLQIWATPSAITRQCRVSPQLVTAPSHIRELSSILPGDVKTVCPRSDNLAANKRFRCEAVGRLLDT